MCHCTALPEARKDGVELYSANITHNLNKMAEAAGIYKCLWRPDENGFVYASDIIDTLANGVAQMATYRAEFEKFNASNGWGTYEDFLMFCLNYLQACKDYPNALVKVWR